MLCACCLSGCESKSQSVDPKTADLQALDLDEESQITMEEIVDDTLKLHSASDVRVLYTLWLSFIIATFQINTNV